MHGGDTDRQPAIAPPRCPDWCECGHDGWELNPGAVTKTCRRVIPVSGYGYTGEVILERFADLTLPGVEIEPTIVRIESDCDQMNGQAAVLLAETIIRAADLVLERAAAA